MFKKSILSIIAVVALLIITGLSMWLVEYLADIVVPTDPKWIFHILVVFKIAGIGLAALIACCAPCAAMVVPLHMLTSKI